MIKSFKKIISLLLVIGLNWAGLSAVSETRAYFNDLEISSGDVYSAGILDMAVRSGQNNFIPPAENMNPGDSTARDIYVGKTALSLPLKHQVSFEFTGGDLDLCGQLDLKIWYNHYECHRSYGDCRDMRLTYNGKLSALNNYFNADFIIPHPDDWFDIDPSDGTEQWFYYSISLPNDADSYQGKTCSFNFIYEGQQNNTNFGAGGFSDVEKISNTISTESSAEDYDPTPGEINATAENLALAELDLAELDSNDITKQNNNIQKAADVVEENSSDIGDDEKETGGGEVIEDEEIKNEKNEIEIKIDNDNSDGEDADLEIDDEDVEAKNEDDGSNIEEDDDSDDDSDDGDNFIKNIII